MVGLLAPINKLKEKSWHTYFLVLTCAFLRTSRTNHYGTMLPAFYLFTTSGQDLQYNLDRGCIKNKKETYYLHCRITSISSSRSRLLISSLSSTTSRLMSDFRRDAYKDTYVFRSFAFLNSCSQERFPLHS